MNEDFLVIHGEFLKDHIRTGMEVISDLILHPAFPEDEIEKERYKLIADLENEKSSPDFLAQRRFEKAIFTPHPYSLYKNQASLQEITQTDLLSIYQKFFGAQDAFLVMAGDITPDEAQKLATEFLGPWKPKSPNQAELNSPVKLTRS